VTAAPLDLRLVPAALAAWVVAWQVRVLPPPWVVPAAALLAAVGIVVLLRGRRGWAAGVAAALLCASAAGLAATARTASRTAEPLPALAERRAAVVVTGALVEDPRLAAGQAGGRELVVVRVRAERLTAAGQSYALRAPVLVLTQERAWLPLLPGQQVRAEGRLGPAERGDDVAAVLSGRGPPVVLGRPSVAQRVAGRLRAGLRDAVAVLPDAERGLLPGLVVGDTSRLDEDLREDFRLVGLTHLTAVSGTNCAIVAGAALLLARRLRLGSRGAAGAAALALLFFVVLARPSPSVLRAAVMGGVGLLALASGSRRQAVPALAAAVLLLVLLDPDLAATPGFALSVLATGGLLLVAPTWRERLGRVLPQWLADALAVPAAAQLLCGPVVVALSGQLGLLSVPANLLAVVAVAPATVLGVLVALLAPVSLPLAQLVAWLAYPPTAWLVLVARTGAAVPGASVGWPDGRRGALLLIVATVVAGVLLSWRGSRRAVAAAGVGVLLAVVALAAGGPSWPPPGWFLVACDVGQGDAQVLSLGDGSAVVVDVGPDPRLVDACLRRLDVERVPLVLLTHLHADHVEGLPGVLRDRAVGQLQVGPLDEPPAQWRRVRGWAQDRGVPVLPAAVGEVRSADGLRWEVLAPARAYRGTNSDPNNSSVVLRVRAGPITVLLTGDVEPDAQRDLLGRGVDLRADVLKVPHHGSSHQHDAFLRAVGARVAVTGVGADNTYGHPSAETLGLLLAGGSRSYRTDRDGDVALVLRDGRLLTSGRDGPGEVRGERLDEPEAADPVPPGPAVLGARHHAARAGQVGPPARPAAASPAIRTPPTGAAKGTVTVQPRARDPPAGR
jgi:competence protein ComEC